MNIVNLILTSSSPFTAEDFLNKLFPNLWSVLINLIALIVLFLVVYFVAYKRIKKYKDARKDYIERNIRDAEQAKRLHEGKAKEADAVIEEANKEALEIIAKAKLDASSSAEKIIEEADKEAAERLIHADEEIKKNEEKARSELHDEIVEIALEASRQVLGREVNEEDNRQLVDDFAKQIAKKGKK